MAHVPNIVRHFQELKSLFSKKTNRGLYCELLVAHYFLKKKYLLIAHREKFQSVEIDLLFQRKRKFFAIEVKSLRDQEFFPYLIGKKQKDRLQRALFYFHSLFKEDVQLHLATVNYKDDIEVFKDILTFF